MRTDVLLPVDFLEDVDLLHRCLSDLFDLLRRHLVRGGDVDDLHRVLLRRMLVDAAAHHAAHSPEDEKKTTSAVRAAHLLFLGLGRRATCDNCWIKCSVTVSFIMNHVFNRFKTALFLVRNQ